MWRVTHSLHGETDLFQPLKSNWVRVRNEPTLTIANAILNQHPDLDEQQLAVIGHRSGPALVMAGPGSGKTACMCLRALNLLLLGRVEPQNLLLCTFTRASALEMRYRLNAGAQAAGYAEDLSGLRVITIHSLCHRMLAEIGPGAGVDASARVLNAGGQLGLLRACYDAIFLPDQDALVDHGWTDSQRIVAEARRFFDRIADELIDPQHLIGIGHPILEALGRCNQRYRAVRKRRGLIDFAGMQTIAHRLLENPRVARRLGGGIHHLLVDEYQDTNLAQQSILFRLADAHRNACIVGDEDQLIYAFRGANPHGFGKFQDGFPEADAFILTGNYRSHRDVVAACNAWINSFVRNVSTLGINTLRTSRRITPQAVHADDDHPGVVSVSGVSQVDEAVQLAGLLLRLKNQDFIGGWHEVAILLPSVRGKRADLYHDVLTELNIPVCRDRAHDAFDSVGNAGGDTSNDGYNTVKPAARVLLTTIHQAKGREWPVVCAAGLNIADLRPNEIDLLLGDHFPGLEGRATRRSVEIDLVRQYYVAFTRAQRVLVLSCARQPHRIFRLIWGTAAPWDEINQSRLNGRGKFVAKATSPALGTRSFPKRIVVPARSTLVVRTNYPDAPLLTLQTQESGPESPGWGE